MPNQGFREIPVQHEGQDPNAMNQGVRGRQIPIHVEQGNHAQRSTPPSESYGWRVKAPEQYQQTSQQHPSAPPKAGFGNAPPNSFSQNGAPQQTQHAPPPPVSTQAPSQSKPAEPAPSQQAHFQAKPQVNKPGENQSNNGQSQGGLKPPEQPARAPSPVQPNMTPLQQVQLILQEANELQERVNVFNGAKGDKDYMYLEEMLTRKLLKLDNIMSEGNEEIRNTRRQAVKTVQSSLDHLELKAFANAEGDGGNTNSHNNGGQEEDCSGGVKDLALDSEVKC